MERRGVQVSATPDTPLSLREARQREAMLAAAPDKNAFHPAVVAARRATDEALVQAAIGWVMAEAWQEMEDGRFTSIRPLFRLVEESTDTEIAGEMVGLSASAVLDAVEKGTDE